MSSLLSLTTPFETQMKAAKWCRVTRKRKGFKSRKSLQDATGIPEATIKHFEVSGNIQLGSFLIIFSTIADLDQVNKLFEQRDEAPKNMDEVLNT